MGMAVKCQQYIIELTQYLFQEVILLNLLCINAFLYLNIV